MRNTLQSITILLAVSFAIACNYSTPAAKIEKNTEAKAVNQKNLVSATGNLIELKPIRDEIVLNMVYADTANFTHSKLYPCAKCYLSTEMVNALLKAAELANKNGNQLLIYDCYRPFSVQKRMFTIVNNEAYVAKPGKGSLHNKGYAVDVGLCNAKGQALDMGSGFDEFSEKSHLNYSGLTSKQKANRHELLTIMKSVGLKEYESEWWHFFIPDSDAEVLDFTFPCE